MNNRNDASQSPEESHKQRQDFDDGASDLWSLYGKEARIYDESRIKTLKGDMEGILIFVRVYFPSGDWSARILISFIPGRFIFCCSYCVRRVKDPGFKSEPRTPVSLLPESNRSYA